MIAGAAFAARAVLEISLGELQIDTEQLCYCEIHLRIRFQCAREDFCRKEAQLALRAADGFNFWKLPSNQCTQSKNPAACCHAQYDRSITAWQGYLHVACAEHDQVVRVFPAMNQFRFRWNG